MVHFVHIFVLLAVVLLDVTSKLSISGVRNVGSGYDDLSRLLYKLVKGSENIDQNLKEKDICKIVEGMGSTQQMLLKSMDGVTHSMRNAFKERSVNCFVYYIFMIPFSSSLKSRFIQFVKLHKGKVSKKKSSKSLKEAAKLMEYIMTVERSMQAAEWIQAVLAGETKKREKFIYATGLVEVNRQTISTGKLRCLVSLLEKPKKDILNEITNSSFELVIVLADNSSREVFQMVEMIYK